MHSQIIERLKASGIFDQFRKECIADVDTKPAYINLHSRVVQSVDDYLKNVHWSSKLQRFGVREGMRKQIVDSSYFQKGVDRIVNQTVDPKINTSFFPVIENAVYEFLGVQKPCGDEFKEESEEDKKCWVQPMDIDPPQESNEESHDIKPNLELLPNQLEDVKPAKDIKLEEELSDDSKLVIDTPAQDEEKMDEEDDEEESPPFEVIGLTSPPHPIPSTSMPLEEIQTPAVSAGDDIQMTDFTNCFAKPVTDKEQLSNDSSDVTDNSVFIPNPPSEKKESKSSTNKESSSKDRSSSSSSNKKSSDKDKDKSSSSNKERSSSSHSHSKSKSKHRDHSSSRDKDKNYSDKSNDKDKDRSKKESSSSKYVSKSSSDSKHSRSSHSSSSRRHSSTSHSKDNRSSSDKSKTDDKSSSKYKEKDSKTSGSHKESSRSHSSSSKDHDKNKHSSSSSRKSSSSRSGHDHKSSKSKSSSKYDKEKSDSHRSSDESSNKAKSYQVSNEEPHSPLPPPPQAMDSQPSIQEQMSPDVNEGGLDSSHAQFHGGSSPKIISDHEESALDKWYGSTVVGTEAQTTGDLVSFSNSKLEPPSDKVNDQLPEDMEIVSSNSTISDQEDNSNCYAYSPSIPCQSEVQLAPGAEEPCPTSLPDVPPVSEVPDVVTLDADFERKKQERESRAQLLNSLRDITASQNFVEKRKYLFELMDPFYDEAEIPVSPPISVPKAVVVIENCNVNDVMIKWLKKKGARVHLKK